MAQTVDLNFTGTVNYARYVLTDDTTFNLVGASSGTKFTVSLSGDFQVLGITGQPQDALWGSYHDPCELEIDVNDRGYNARYSSPTNDQVVEAIVWLQGYGMMGATPGTPGRDLGAGWDPLDYFDAIEVAGVGCILDTVDGSVQFSKEGLWDVNFMVNFDHDESNQGRTIFVRAYNLADTVEIGRVSVGIGRNQSDTLVSFTARFPIDAANLNDRIQFQAGGGSAVIVGDYEQLVMSPTLVSPFSIPTF